MGSTCGDVVLVATAFSYGPTREFKDFLADAGISSATTRILKGVSSADPLAVAEHTFLFRSDSKQNNSFDLAIFRASVYKWSKLAGNVDVAIQEESVFRRHKRLVVFDMDSTLIKQEVIDEIAKHLDTIDPARNVGKRVAVLPLKIISDIYEGNHGIGNARTNRF
jgi:hypothetical protein